MQGERPDGRPPCTDDGPQTLSRPVSPCHQTSASGEGSRCLATVTLCGCNSVVECQLPKLNVAGSSPVTRLPTAPAGNPPRPGLRIRSCEEGHSGPVDALGMATGGADTSTVLRRHQIRSARVNGRRAAGPHLSNCCGPPGGRLCGSTPGEAVSAAGFDQLQYLGPQRSSPPFMVEGGENGLGRCLQIAFLGCDPGAFIEVGSLPHEPLA